MGVGVVFVSGNKCGVRVGSCFFMCKRTVGVFKYTLRANFKQYNPLKDVKIIKLIKFRQFYPSA